MTAPPKSANEAKPQRDWFGYVFTTVAGIIVAAVFTWYQLYSTQRDVAAAELERARAVKQTGVAIVEEHVLNGKKLELERLARLIDQRRRDENISIPVPISEIVEQAEFNIANSHYLPIDRKEEIKPFFELFYTDLRSRTFQPATSGTASANALNDVARKIQDGKAAEALAALKRLHDIYDSELAAALKTSKPSVVDALAKFFSSPLNIFVFIVFMIVYFWGVLRLKRHLAAARRRQMFS